jgi:hypothetical protein
MQRIQAALISVCCVASLACSSSEEPVSLGEDPPAITGERLSDYAASWEGYTEAFRFPSGTDRVRLTLAEDGTGTLIVGEDAPLPPVPTDPSVGPGFVTGRQLLAGPALQGFVFDGFPFSVRASSVEARRLRLGAELNEPYRDWCELQTSYPIVPETGLGYYACVPDGISRGNGDFTDCARKPEGTEAWTAIDCEKLSLCGAQTCDCDATGCTVAASDSLEDQSIRLDGALLEGGAELVGTLVFGDHGRETERATVRFARN